MSGDPFWFCTTRARRFRKNPELYSACWIGRDPQGTKLSLQIGSALSGIRGLRHPISVDTYLPNAFAKIESLREYVRRRRKSGNGYRWKSRLRGTIFEPRMRNQPLLLFMSRDIKEYRMGFRLLPTQKEAIWTELVQLSSH